MSQTLIVVVSFCFLLLAGCQQSPVSERPDIVNVRSDDTEMNAAMDEARNTLPAFMQRLSRPQATDKLFLVKGRFSNGTTVEHIWVADISFDGKCFSGVLANEPIIPKLRLRQPVRLSVGDISDWMYISEGRLVGGYTIRVAYRRMSPEQRKKEFSQASYRIDE